MTPRQEFKEFLKRSKWEKRSVYSVLMELFWRIWKLENGIKPRRRTRRPATLAQGYVQVYEKGGKSKKIDGKKPAQCSKKGKIHPCRNERKGKANARKNPIRAKAA